MYNDMNTDDLLLHKATVVTLFLSQVKVSNLNFCRKGTNS